MRIKTPLAALLLAALVVACDQSPPTEPSADAAAPPLSAHSGPGTPVVIVIPVLLTDEVNPCTGEIHDVLIVNTLAIHTLKNNTVISVTRVLTTTDGFEGRGSGSLVTNKNVATFMVQDIVTNPATGQKFQVHGQQVIDLGTGTPKDRGANFFMRCIRG